MPYAHLSQNERYQIQLLQRAGFSLLEIGQQLLRHPSTIGRELRRNRQIDSYDARAAQRRSVLRRHQASARPRIAAETWLQVKASLREEHSPEQIAGRGMITVSHERIYQYLAQDRARGGNLWRCLRRRKRRRHHRCGTPRQRFGGRRIHERPAIVALRARVGDWEGDTILGKCKARVVTLVERKSGLLRLRKIASGEAAPTLRAIVHALYPLHPYVHTLTLDNGSEFAAHELIDIALHTCCYFADPFASWQRGSNENTNGLLRQYLAKDCNLAAVSEQQLQRIEDRINNRPRKRLGFRTPNEVFYDHLKRAALRS